MKSNENIDEYINELRRLSNNCKFGTLTDSLVLGIKDRALKDRLLTEASLDLKKAIYICKATKRYEQQKQLKCFLCGRSHPKGHCPARNSKCYNCKKVGHYSRMCRVKKISTVDKGSDEEVELFIDNFAILGLEVCVELDCTKKECISKCSRNKEINDILEQYKICFEGLGCLSGTYHIEIDKTVKPGIHPPRKVPFALKNELKRKLESLVKQNVVEKVTEATDWVNSLVRVHKKDQNRLYIDPIDLNKAIKRHHFQIRTLDEILNGTDPYLALLMLRNTPISSEIPSPAQILYSRRLRDILPSTGKMLRKTIVNDRLIKEKFEESKHKQKIHYDRRVRDLEDLEKGERVKVKISLKDKEWKLGRIVTKLRRPRSYLVQLDTGTKIARNRRYILKLNIDIPMNDDYQLEYQNQIDYYLSNTEEEP
ncbi:hypothetical protein Trydic_g10965 [Trypoxylus dichotomus]